MAHQIKVKMLKHKQLLMVLPWQSYGTSPAIWNRTMLPATRHKSTLPALISARKRLLKLPTPEGSKAELTCMVAEVVHLPAYSYSSQYKSGLA